MMKGCASRRFGFRLSVLVRGGPGQFRLREPRDGTDLRDCPVLPGEGDLPVALYMYQVSYTSEAIAAQVREPQDRIEAVRPVIEAMGGKLLAAGYPLGEYDAVVLFEAPDDPTAAGFALAIAAGGAGRSAKTTRLLSGQEWIESLRKAQGSVYRPPQ
jgi:uncharacterized protein with GYD domain